MADNNSNNPFNALSQNSSDVAPSSDAYRDTFAGRELKTQPDKVPSNVNTIVSSASATPAKPNLAGGPLSVGSNSNSSININSVFDSLTSSQSAKDKQAYDSAFNSAFNSAFASANSASNLNSNSSNASQSGFVSYLVNGNQNVYANGTSYDLDSAANALANGSGVASTTISGVTSNVLNSGSNNGSNVSSATSDGLYNIDVIVPTTSNVDKNAQGSADAQHLTDVESRDKANLVRDLKKAGLTQEQGKNITDKIEKAATKDAKNNNKTIIDAQGGNFNYHQDLIMNNKKIDPTLQKQIQKDQAMLYNHEMENKENMINNYRQAGLSQDNINQRMNAIDKATSTKFGLSTGKGQSKVYNTVSTDTIESEEQANGLSNNNVGRFLAEQKLKSQQAPTTSATNNPLDSALNSANNQSLIQQFNQMFALDVKNGTATQKDAQMYNILNNKNGQNVSTTLSKYQSDNNTMSNAAQKQKQNTTTSGKSNSFFPSNDPTFE